MSDGRVTLGDMARLRALFSALRAAEIMRPAGDGRTDDAGARPAGARRPQPLRSRPAGLALSRSIR